VTLFALLCFDLDFGFGFGAGRVFDKMLLAFFLHGPLLLSTSTTHAVVLCSSTLLFLVGRCGVL
jgi:hypothetical protein